MKDIKNLENLFLKGKITRREFIARISALGLTAAISPALLATTARAAEPKKGGRFRMGSSYVSTTDTLDPSIMKSSATYLPSWACRNNLVEVDYKGNAIPELATSWEASSDVATWVFKLRKGVEFHNGKTLEAEDVIYSINIHRGETKSAVKSLLAPIKELKADGKDTVIFTLDAGNLDFPYVLSAYHLPIAPAGTKGRDWDKCIGTGAFVMQSFEPGVRAFAKRNPNYWKKGRGHFDELEILYISDTSSRTNALKTGRIDWMDAPELKTIDLLEKDKKLQILNIPGSFHYNMTMRTDTKPYDNNDVRLALKYAIDRELIIKNLLYGYGTIANDHPIGRTYRYYADALSQRTYDPDKVKYHLKKAGLEGHKFKLHVAPMKLMLDSALLYQQSAKKAGLDIEIVQRPADGYWSNVWMKEPFFGAWWMPRPTADGMFTTAWAADSKWNESYWKHERFNMLLKEARRERDVAKRKDMYVEMQKIARDEAGIVVYMFMNFVQAASKKVKFKNIAGNFDADGLRAPERWWYES